MIKAFMRLPCTDGTHRVRLSGHGGSPGHAPHSNDDADWEEWLGGFLKLWDRDILQDVGKVTAELAKAHTESEFEKYRIVQDRLFESDFDRMLKQIAQKKGGGK
jgi:hypothetical protein